MGLYFCYPDNEVRTSARSVVAYEKLNAVKHWSTHFSNSLYLTFLVRNEPALQDRNQASKELATAERKMQYWTKHPNWNAEAAALEADKLRKQWEPSRKPTQ